MLALSESVVIMEKHVMGHLYRKILNRYGPKSAPKCVKEDANVILDITEIQTADNVF
jgi:hypothetical protein